ncbi:hypothetical protein H696_03721 [Fonticula alba]|uniref:PITH domain-containing protein n=1 Tax=Fonticula alba TaxID=691883 RepID=A0A058Z6X4_FONAL|nr:hypothetical protein H696_03721 [Fonticula alba]KCV69287.1 hypothetical protein H696_03721 [Fonticula alba]|eukprot:XP_009495852.1 hypothetical protein H696_03721 [Fonticula alba]
MSACRESLGSGSGGHGHSHGHGAGGCGDGHDHDDTWERGAEYSLFRHIDQPRTHAYNCRNFEKDLPIFKPWEDRLTEDPFIISDADDQMLVYIPFLGGVTLKGFSLVGGDDGQCPSKVKLFINRSDIDFQMAEELPPAQEFHILNKPGQVIEYQTRISKFQNVESLTMFFAASHGAPETSLSYIGLKGDFRPLNRRTIITMYEAAANPADHPVKLGTKEYQGNAIDR